MLRCSFYAISQGGNVKLQPYSSRSPSTPRRITNGKEMVSSLTFFYEFIQTDRRSLL